MKRIALLLVSFCLAFGVQAKTFTEGVHYKVVSSAPAKPGKLTEYFSFYCPHCYRFEHTLSLIKPELPDGMKINKVHVNGLPLAPEPMQKALSRALAVVEVLKLPESTIAALFKRIHENKKKPRSEAEIRQVFLDLGVDAKKLNSAWNSMIAIGKTNRMNKQWQSLPREISAVGVPSLIVNDKYWINASKLGSLEDYKQLIAHLNSLK